MVVDGERRVRVAVDEYGRAVFDGLTPGDYKMSVFAPGYPQEQRVLVEPRKVTLDARGCGIEVLVTAPVR